MKILLTGPTGFIGSAFARLALRRGHQLLGLIIPSETPPRDLAAHPGMHWTRGTLDRAPLDDIDAFRPETCVHTAWVTAPGVYLESPDNFKFLESSRTFLREVVARGVTHVVGLGTCIEYRIGKDPLSEDTTPVEPATTYARCKNELRLALETEARGGAFNLCWARVFYPYGPGEHPSRLCTSLIRKLQAGEQMVLKTPDSTKDYIFIEDLAEALLLLVEKKVSGPINLGTGEGKTVREIAETLETLLGKTGLVREQDPPAADPLGFVVADAHRLRGLGWTPHHDLRSGLKKLMAAVGPKSEKPL